MSYLETTADFYRQVAQSPEVGLCCVSSSGLQLPGLVIPAKMQQMNYGCGTTVHPLELSGNPTVLYVGVGGGLEALQFAYFSRKPGGVIAVDPVSQMREVALENLAEAAKLNDWFDLGFVEVVEGDAFHLPVGDGSVDVIAQNCLFNIFTPCDLQLALREAYRVLRCGGRLMMSDPIALDHIPAHLQADERLRAMCLSGALTYSEYVDQLVGVGFGQVEVRGRRPYRLLDPVGYGLSGPLLLDSLDTVSYKVMIPEDGACVFTGKTAIYYGDESVFDDGAGHLLTKGVPAVVCDKTALKLGQLYPDVIYVTSSTWHYNGGGCC